jgi:formamidopyrimidine-DNA glycosylase
MPELPEVETVRRMLEQSVRGLTIRSVSLSGLRLRQAVAPALPRTLRGRTIESVGRRGKYLMIGLSGGLSLLSHLGMSGRWLVLDRRKPPALEHVHARIRFTDGTSLWYQDVRRFGLLRLLPTIGLDRAPELAELGPDPLDEALDGACLRERSRGIRAAVKTFLMDQRRVAGLGNIYASEILHRARIDPRRPAGSLDEREWVRVAAATRKVLDQAVSRMGTTFSAYRTIWGEPGEYGSLLRVYDRAGLRCRRCGTVIRRIVQGQRSTYYCPVCQPPRKRRGTRRFPTGSH